MDLGRILNTDVDPATSTPASSFPKFACLPTEIRLKIWYHAHPIRILPIKCPSPIDYHLSEADNGGIKFLCAEPPPTLLSVCHESRYETLRCYVLISDEPAGHASGHKFYFNPYQDTIFLDASRAVEWQRIIRAIESHTRILSLALRNAHRYPHSFAIAVVAERGMREMFMVGTFEEYGYVPEVWALLPRKRGGGRVKGGEMYCYGRIIACIDRWERGEEKMPKVTAVKEGFWKREGLGLVGRW